MKDGSDAIADWPILNALINTAAGAHWVSVHHGGGVGIGYSIHAGMVVVADGTRERARAPGARADVRSGDGRDPSRRRRLRARARGRRRARRPDPHARTVTDRHIVAMGGGQDVGRSGVPLRGRTWWIDRGRRCVCCRRRRARCRSRSCGSSRSSRPTASSRRSSICSRATTVTSARLPLAQDLIFVGGGNTANLLAVWRVHGLDDDPAGGVGVGRRPGRRERRRELLVRGEHHGFVRPAGAVDRRSRACCPAASVRTTRTSPAGVRCTTALVARRVPAGDRVRRPSGRALRRDRRSRRSWRRIASSARVPGLPRRSTGSMAEEPHPRPTARRLSVSRCVPSVPRGSLAAVPVGVGGALTLADVVAVARGAAVEFPDDGAGARGGRPRGGRAGRRVGRDRLRRHHRVRLARRRADRSVAGRRAPTRDRAIARDRRRATALPRGGAGDAPAARARAGARPLGRAPADRRPHGRDAEPRPDPVGAGAGLARRLGRPRAAREPGAAADRAGRAPDGRTGPSRRARRSPSPDSRRSRWRRRRGSRSSTGRRGCSRSGSSRPGAWRTSRGRPTSPRR